MKNEEFGALVLAMLESRAHYGYIRLNVFDQNTGSVYPGRIDGPGTDSQDDGPVIDAQIDQ